DEVYLIDLEQDLIVWSDALAYPGHQVMAMRERDGGGRWLAAVGEDTGGGGSTVDGLEQFADGNAAVHAWSFSDPQVGLGLGVRDVAADPRAPWRFFAIDLDTQSAALDVDLT